MSAPVVNSLPPSGAPAPTGTVPPLSLVSGPKTTPAPAPAAKPVVNHSAAAAGVESKAKTPEKAKELPKPTSNGLEDSQSLKAPVTISEEPSVTPTSSATAVSASTPPTASQAVGAAAAPPVGAPPVAQASAAAVPSAPAVAVPSVVNHASAADAPQVATEPSGTVPPPEPAKPKSSKSASKRRLETSAAVPATTDGTPEKKPRRMRAPVNPYQSPLPEMTTILNRSLKVRDNSQKPNDEKLIVFYKNEFLAVRNAEGGFYLCQTMQNIYRTSHKIRICWLSRDEKESGNDGVYTRDFYDTTDFECILTTVALKKKDRNQYKMPAAELERVESILKRALDVEKGVSEKPAVTEEHPDGIDLSLYKDESQLSKPKNMVKRKRSPPRKSKSPKRAKKVVKAKSPSKSNKVAKGNTSRKEKTLVGKAPAKRVAPPPVEKKPTRAERSSAREKTAVNAVATKPSKVPKAAVTVTKNSAAKRTKRGTLVNPPSASAEKKQEKKSKSTPPPPVPSTSKKGARGKKEEKPGMEGSGSKRGGSTRKKGRK